MCDLIAVTNRHLCKGDFLDRIRLLVDCRVPKILLREKDLLPEAYEELSHKVLEICRATDTKCILHNYVDAALHEKADAIHLPLQTALTEKEKLTAFSHLGISTHSIEQVRKAEDIGAAYVTYGHVFATDCKKDVPPRGLASLAEITAQTELPVYAIGGIHIENVRSALAAGAKGVCIMSTAMQAEQKEIQKFLEL
nr:thiamine phosphate synthase [Roseburia zhanii]